MAWILWLINASSNTSAQPLLFAWMGLLVAVDTGSCWEESREALLGASPAAWLSLMEVLPTCFCRSAVALLLIFVQLNLSYLNLLLEKPLCCLKHVLYAFWFLFITLVRNVVILTFDYLLCFPPLLHFCSWCFPFLGWNAFPRIVRPRSLAVCAVTLGNTQHLGTNTLDGDSLLRRAHVSGAHPAVDTTLGGCGSPERSSACCQTESLTPAGLCSLAAMQLMKLPWTSSWFKACEIFRLVHHLLYFVSAGFADINSDRMRSALNSSENLSSKEFVFLQ